MIQTTFDNATKPLLTPEALYGTREKKSDVCIITFSYKAVQWALEHLRCEQIAKIGSTGYRYPIYRTEWMGKKICFHMTMISAAAAAACLEEARCLTGAQKYILFGSSGTLDRSRTDGKLMVPTAAYRDEGVSYHYVPAADYIEMKHWETVAAFFEKQGVSYITGKTWTTDGLYRETAGNAEKRRQEGCISVEMEAAALYMNAARAKKHALAICTVSDHILHHEATTAEERQNGFTQMMELALRTAVKLEK